MAEHRDIQEKTDVKNDKERNRIDTRTNALRINKIPVFCKHCGVGLENVSLGTYRCPSCNKEYYDDYQKIRNFIRENGPAPAFVIVRGTGVSKQTVESFFEDDVKRVPEEINLAKIRETNIRRQMPKGNEGMWHSNIWKR